jgi:hypothetical protein
MAYVVKPLDIVLISKTTEENGQNVNVDVSAVVLKISPHTVRLLSAVAASMQTAKAVRLALVCYVCLCRRMTVPPTTSW